MGSLLMFLLVIVAVVLLARIVGGFGACLCLLLVVCLVVSADGYANVHQAYSDQIAERTGVPAVVHLHKFHQHGQMGQSRVKMRDGAIAEYQILVAQQVASGRTKVWKNTIRHEMCHLVVVKEHGTATPDGRYHGRAWKECAKELRVDFRNTILD